jgi:uncharacterized coiled-coil DUF342 family protein
MSKLIDSLNKVQATLTETPRNIASSTSGKGQGAGPSASGLLHFTKQTFYSLSIAVVLIVILAFSLSYKAFGLIQERNSHITQLISAIHQQNDKIKSLENSIATLSSQQQGQMVDIKNSLAAIDQRINKTTKEVAEVVIHRQELNTQIKDLKTENSDIKNKYNSLIAEFNKVKQTLAKMMGETAEIK